MSNEQFHALINFLFYAFMIFSFAMGWRLGGPRQ